MKTLTKIASVSASLAMAALPMASLAVDQATLPKATQKCLKVEAALNGFAPKLQKLMDDHFVLPSGAALDKYPIVTAPDTHYQYRSSTWADKTHYNYAIARARWGTTLNYLQGLTYSSGEKKDQRILDTTKLENLLANFDNKKKVAETLVTARIAQINDKALYPELTEADCTTRDGIKKINARVKDYNGTIKAVKAGIKDMYQKPIHDEIQRLIKIELDARKDKTHPVKASKPRTGVIRGDGSQTFTFTSG